MALYFHCPYIFIGCTGVTLLWKSITVLQIPLIYFPGFQLTDGIFGAFIVRQPAKREPHFKQYDVDDPSHVIVINEWSHGFAIQRLLEPNPDTSTASLLINGRSQPKARNSVISFYSIAIYNNHLEQPRDPHSLRFGGYCTSFLAAKRQWRDFDHPSPSSTDFENEYSHTSSSALCALCYVMGWLLTWDYNTVSVFNC